MTLWYLLRNKKSHIVHRAVKEGGGSITVLMASCGTNIRWDQPHPNWERAPWRGLADSAHITCKKCLQS